MTQPLVDLQEQIVTLANSFPPPVITKLERQLPRLERMALFYEEKSKEAPTKQSLLFLGFINSLTYSIAMIKDYKLLTQELAMLAERIERDDVQEL